MTILNIKHKNSVSGLPVIFLLTIVCLFSSCKKPGPEQKNATLTKAELDTVSKKVNAKGFENNFASEIGPSVLSILQDKNDNYWFGTNDGVYRYNGKSLILFTVSDGLFQNQIQDIQEDRSGNIWFTTAGYGVNRFDGKAITSLKANQNSQMSNTLNKNLKIEQGDLWFNAGGGALQYSNDSLAYLPFNKHKIDSGSTFKPPYQPSEYGVYSILKDRNGNLWFGTQSMGVCRYDGKTFTWFEDHELLGPAVLALFEDSKGILWFGNNGKGLFRYDGKTLTNFTEEKGLSNPDFNKSGKEGPGTLARVWSINEDNNGDLWIGTGDAGVWRYDGKDLTNYTAKDGLPDSGIETIYKDKKGMLWFGTNGGGVYQFSNNFFTKFIIRK